MGKKLIIIFGILFLGLIAVWPVYGVETPERISDREIVERLTRLEEGQKALLREMDTRFESIDKRFESIDKRFGQMIDIMIGIIAAFAGIVAVTIIFALWDRRTMIRPFEDKVKKVEDAVAQNRANFQKFLEVLRSQARTDEKLAEVLRSFSLM